VLAKPIAFFLRDLRTAMSYRLSFATTITTLLFSLATLQLTSRLVEQGSPQALEPFGNDYFTFALIGTSIALFCQIVSGSFPGTIRNAQVMGTLEVLLGTRTTLAAFLVYSSSYAVLFGLVQLFAGFVVGYFVLDARLAADQVFATFLVLTLTAAIFAGIGIMGAAFVVRYKQREPVTGLLLTGSILLGGVLYPTSVLPSWLSPIAPLLPLTHAATALRETLLQGVATTNLTNEILILAAFAVLFPLSLVVFSYAVHRAKVVGSLSQY
jgi:ABC-2 type transport system permease protein